MRKGDERRGKGKGGSEKREERTRGERGGRVRGQSEGE